MSRLCLNMIVKNEAHVIRRCLVSLRDHIDYWVIVDTGSTDGTQSIIKEFLKEIPGELHERPWVDFGHNRTEALRLAESHADYLLFIDADEQLRVSEGFIWPQLTADAYYVNVEYGNLNYARCAIVATRKHWDWIGVLHEYLKSTPDDATRATLDGVGIFVTHDGARAKDPDTYKKDVEVLAAAVKLEPNNARNVFYLAQSYRDCNEPEKAIQYYEERIALKGWEEEVWYSMYQIARMYERKGSDPKLVQNAYLRAIQYRPLRAETLLAFADYCTRRGESYLACVFAKEAAALPLPKDVLFVESNVYLWRALDVYSVSSYYCGRKEDGAAAVRRLLNEKRYPSTEAERLKRNAVYFGVATGSCPVCKTESKNSHAGTPYQICPECDAWFQDPMPPKLFHAEHEDSPESMPQYEVDINISMARSLFVNLINSKPCATLDIGARRPVMAAELLRLGCTAFGMDPEPSTENLGVTMLRDNFEDFNDEPFAGHFGLITMIHVFEHMYDPIAAIRKMTRMLAENGRIFLRLPDHAVQGFERDLTPGHFKIHPFFHTLKSVQRVLKEAGDELMIVSEQAIAPGQRDLVLKRKEQRLDNYIDVVRPGAIGDIIMTLNMIPHLKAQNPDAKIRYFCHSSYASPAALGRTILAAGADEVLPSDQPATPAARRFNLIGYPLEEGYPARPMAKHLLQYFADELGITANKSWINCIPSGLILPKPERPSWVPKGDYIVVQKTAGWSKYKEWLPERWNELLNQLKLPHVVVGAESGITLDEAIAAFANAQLLIGIDSFMNHLTHYRWKSKNGMVKRVCGVVLFGSTQASASGYWHNKNLSTGLQCQPCFKENPAVSSMAMGPCTNPPRDSYEDETPPACMKSITVEQVKNAIRSMLPEAA